jgi:hypothetical protein
VTPVRRRLALGIVVALSGSAVAVWHGAAAQANVLVGGGVGRVGRETGPHAGRLVPAAAKGGSFRIAGSVGGLYPGLTKPLKLTISNPQHFAIVVTSVTVAVGDASQGCKAGNVAVTRFSGRRRVGARGSAQVTLELTLVHAAPDACQGAVFPLRYSGRAVKP